MSVTEPLEFGTLLRRVRTAAGLSQEELAERARMSAAAVSALERGSRKAPYRDTVALLLEALGAEEAERNALTEAAERARRRAAKAESNLEISRPEPAPAGDPHLRSNLQAQVTSFFGRDRELAELEALLQKHRLVTLVGAGGVGKTRLSLHLGERVLGSYPDGVWFVEFAPVSDPQFVASAIASSVGLGSISEADPVSALVGALRAKRMLLILDNCEHLVEELARTAEAIVRTCPQVTLLASSRQGLDVDGERTYRVPPLGMPEVARIATIRADLAMDFSAIRLFTDRAVSVGRGFELTDANAPIVADIVARLDGIPLAIELAAARVKVFSPAELRTRLDERFRLLTGGRRNALPRQQTLHALIGWSYDLLNDREKRLLQRLSVFAGGWTIEAAEAVCSDHLLEAGDVLDALVSLVDKSLVVAEQIGDAMRYRLLESTRAYAHEKLIEAGGAEDTAHRHLRYFRDLFERVRDAYEHFPSEAHVLALQVELSNARAALDFGVTYDPDAAAILLTATVLWGLLGRPAESMQRAEQLISLVRDRRLTSRLWERVAAASINLGLYSRGLTAAEKSIEAAIDCRDSVLEVGARCRQLYCLSVLGVDIEAAMNSLAACNAFKLPTPRLELWLVLAQAQVALAQADLDGKTALAERNVILEKRFGNRQGVGNALIMLSTIEHERGNTLKAIQISRDVMKSAFALENKSIVTWNLANMVGYYVAVDDLDNARQVAALALSVLRERPDAVVPKFLIEHIALFGALSGDYSRAAQLSGFVSRENLMDEYQREYAERVTCERLADILHQSLPEAELAQTLEAGKTLTLMDALEVAAACVAHDGGAAAVKQG